MPTVVASFAGSEVKVRFKEPLLTAGLNEAFTGITPQGIHRGFRLGPSLANLEVTVEADSADNDHVAAYATADGYTLRLRRTGGDFGLDLSPFVSKTVVIAIFAEYAPATDTFAEIRAYELDPADEFTGAPERGELVVLGAVVVPAAGVIPTADILPSYRTLAWDHVGSDAAEWEQIVENSGFELAATDAPFVAQDRGFVPHWATQYIPAAHTWEITAVNPYTGRYALKVTGSGVTALSVIPPERIVAVRPGQLVRVSYWVRGEVWTGAGGGGTQGVQLNFFGPDLGLVAFRRVQDGSLVGTFGWTQFDEYVEVPSGAAWMVPAITVYDTTAATGSLVFDEVRIWAEKGPATIPYDSVRAGLTDGGLVVGQLGVAETNVSQFGITQDLESYVKGILTLHKLDNVAPGVNRYRWRRLDEEPFALRLVEGAIRLDGIVGSGAETQFPRIKAEISDPLTGPFTNVLEVYSQAYAAAARRYHQADALLAAIRESINARFDTGTGQYNLDDVAQDAVEWVVSNHLGGYCALFGHDHLAGVAWPIWEELLEIYPDITVPHCELVLRDGKLVFDRATAESNPAAGAAVAANALYAKNTPKAWAYITTDGSGGDVVQDGFGFSAVIAAPSNNIRRLTLLNALANTNYLILVNQQSTGTPTIIMAGNAAGVSTIDVGGWNTNGGLSWNFAGGTALNFSILVFGED